MGRVRIGTDARTATEHRRALVLFDRLVRNGRLDIVRALVDERITWRELHDAHRDGRLERSLDVLLLRQPLRRCIDKLYPECSKGTPKRYRVSFLKLLRLAGEILVEKLLSLDWAPLRPHFASAADWNHLRRAVSRLLSVLVGKGSALRQQAVARIPIAKEVARMPDVSKDDLKRFITASPEWLRPIIVFLVGTGIRFGEFKAGRLVKDAFYCGTKSDASARIIPLAPALLPVARRALANRKSDVTIRRAWTKARLAAGLPELRRHDLRHVAAQLLDEAGRPLSSIQATLGHATIQQTAEYAKKRLRRADSEALADQIGGLISGL